MADDLEGLLDLTDDLLTTRKPGKNLGKIKLVKSTIDLYGRYPKSDDRKAQQVELYGPYLALFKVQYGWNISHVNTGRRIIEFVGVKSLALEVLEILNEADWNFGEFGQQFLLKDMPESVAEACKQASRKIYGEGSRY